MPAPVTNSQTALTRDSVTMPRPVLYLGVGCMLGVLLTLYIVSLNGKRG